MVIFKSFNHRCEVGRLGKEKNNNKYKTAADLTLKISHATDHFHCHRSQP